MGQLVIDGMRRANQSVAMDNLWSLYVTFGLSTLENVQVICRWFSQQMTPIVAPLLIAAIHA